MGLRLRLAIVLAGIFIFSSAIAAFSLVNTAQRSVVAEIEASTELAVTLLNAAVGDRLSNNEPRAAKRMLEQLGPAAAFRHLRIHSRDTLELTPPTFAGDAPAWFAEWVRPPPTMLQQPLQTGLAEIFVVADPNAEIEEAWRELRTTMGLFLLLFAGASAMLFLFLGRALNPLGHLSTALRGVEEGRYGERLSEHGIPEVDVLYERFNAMADSLERSEQETAFLAQRSLAIQEEERHHLARELHDDMGQSITAIKALAVSIRERADSVIGDRASTIIEVSSSIYDRVRQMMTRLHPSALDELGLVSALELMVDDWNSHHGDSFCQFNAVRLDADVGPDARINIYRIVQEALTNVAKHAHGAEVRIIIASDDAMPHAGLTLEISDNGPGFDAETQARGLGLLGIRERVNSMQGKFELTTSAGLGTRLAIHVPNRQ